jgi:hypothetical protein
VRTGSDRGNETAEATATEEEVEAPAADRIELEALAELSTTAHQARAAAPAAPPAPGLRTARLVAVSPPASGGRLCAVRWRGAAAPVDAEVAPEVETELLQGALEEGASVLVEVVDGLPPLVVGVLATRVPRSVHLKATTVTIEGEREVLIKTGRAALRLREDGDVELVGSRISASSRGLFRLVGRMLRLN